MRHDVYSMPEIMFVAGQSNTLRWRLFKERNVPFNGEGCEGNFALVDYSDKYNTEPLVSKPLAFSIGDDATGAKNMASVDLLPSDTLGLSGKYVYQITIKDIDGEVEIPNQGIIHIYHNINATFLK